MGGNDASFIANPPNAHHTQSGRVVIRLDRVVQVHEDRDRDSAGGKVLDDGDSAGERKEQTSIV